MHCSCSGEGGFGSHGKAPNEQAARAKPLGCGAAGQQGTPLSDRYVWGLVWQQRGSLLRALTALVVCVAATLASPVRCPLPP